MAEEALGIEVGPGIAFVGGGWTGVAFEGFEVEGARVWVLGVFEVAGELVDAVVDLLEPIGAEGLAVALEGGAVLEFWTRAGMELLLVEGVVSFGPKEVSIGGEARAIVEAEQ